MKEHIKSNDFLDREFLDKVIFEFTQKGNTDGTTEDTEFLTIEMQSCLESLTKQPGYLVLRTETGWSINDPKELDDIINYVKNVLE